MANATTNTRTAPRPEMFDVLGRSDIDAVFIATGDRWHRSPRSTPPAPARSSIRETVQHDRCGESQNSPTRESLRAASPSRHAAAQRRQLKFAADPRPTGKLGKIHTVQPAYSSCGEPQMAAARAGAGSQVVDRDRWLGPSPGAVQQGHINDAGGTTTLPRGAALPEWGAHKTTISAVGRERRRHHAGRVRRRRQTIYAATPRVKLEMRLSGFKGEGKWVVPGTCPERFEGDDGWVEAADTARCRTKPKLLEKGAPAFDGRTDPRTRPHFLDCVKSRKKPRQCRRHAPRPHRLARRRDRLRLGARCSSSRHGEVSSNDPEANRHLHTRPTRSLARLKSNRCPMITFRSLLAALSDGALRRSLAAARSAEAKALAVLASDAACRPRPAPAANSRSTAGRRRAGARGAAQPRSARHYACSVSNRSRCSAGKALRAALPKLRVASSPGRSTRSASAARRPPSQFKARARRETWPAAERSPRRLIATPDAAKSCNKCTAAAPADRPCPPPCRPWPPPNCCRRKATRAPPRPARRCRPRQLSISHQVPNPDRGPAPLTIRFDFGRTTTVSFGLRASFEEVNRTAAVLPHYESFASVFTHQSPRRNDLHVSSIFGGEAHACARTGRSRLPIRPHVRARCHSSSPLAHRPPAMHLPLRCRCSVLVFASLRSFAPARSCFRRPPRRFPRCNRPRPPPRWPSGWREDHL